MMFHLKQNLRRIKRRKTKKIRKIKRKKIKLKNVAKNLKILKMKKLHKHMMTIAVNIRRPKVTNLEVEMEILTSCRDFKVKTFLDQDVFKVLHLAWIEMIQLVQQVKSVKLITLMDKRNKM